MTPRIKTTAVGSYPVPSWLVGNTSRLVLRDAVMAVFKTQELAGLDLITDGELMRFDPSHPETNGMVDYFASRLEGIRKHFSLSDFDRFRSDTGAESPGQFQWIALRNCSRERLRTIRKMKSRTIG